MNETRDLMDVISIVADHIHVSKIPSILKKMRDSKRTLNRQQLVQCLIDVAIRESNIDHELANFDEFDLKSFQKFVSKSANNSVNFYEIYELNSRLEII